MTATLSSSNEQLAAAQKTEPTAPKWRSTRCTNLIRYVPSGIYFARLRVAGKLIQKSLKTDKLSVAEMRLRDLEKAEKKKAAAQTGAAKGRLTFEEAVQTYRERSFRPARVLVRKSLVRLKARSIDYYEQRIVALKKSWPGLFETDVSKVTVTDCQKWAARCHAEEWSGSSFNHTLGVVRQVFEIAIEVGARYDNPALSVPRESERYKKPELMPSDRFDEFVREIETGGSGKSKPCSQLVRFLAYGGFRKGEAAAVTWADCDFQKGFIRVKGDPETGLKGREVGDYRLLPMIAELRTLLEQMRTERATEPSDTPVMRVKECQKAMDRAANALGLPRPTHHALRHLFATRCIESGVDIPTVARWLGHKDGGALAMRVYGHLRDQHSVSMAQKVSFGASVTPNITPLPSEQVA